MERDAELVERRGGQQRIESLREQRPVRHQTDAKAQLPRAGEDLRELRVQQRLAQNVQIQIVRPRPQLPREEPKLLCREHPPRPPRPGAEHERLQQFVISR